ncbi:MAG: branched-chain amino acid ABC transporter permease [Candidatus Tectomicrobia bacterium]|uniref:Branched-chain amino acid ABC transporter permease n=1 Tax=Tectimicrobiota bacterium TaxID=2528274 RepID=A0A933GKI0_UNCTE|nr:branched-chain amino acid ABC transporter permease [Candidatus Tectomicrobia bacterium]
MNLLLRRNWPYFVALLVGLLILFMHSNNYLMYVFTLVAIYAIGAMGLDIMCSWTGMLVFCPSAFAVIGGYTSALLITKLNVPFLVALVIAALAAGFMAMLVTYGALLMKKPFEVVVITYAFEMVVYYLLTNWAWAGGSLGIRNIPYPSLFGLTLETLPSQYILTFVLLGIITIFVLLFYRSRPGLLIRASKEDWELTEALGNSVVKSRLIAFIAGAVLLGISGSLYGFILHTLTPTSFTWTMTVIFFMIIVLGGMGTVLGPIVGALIIVGLPEALHAAGQWRLFIFGFLLIFVIIAFPKGLVGSISRGRV